MSGRIGQQLGNYQLLRLLGQGGFAEVYLGEHVHLGTQAAIKVLHTQLGDRDIEQFRQEARTIAHLEHPHIVRVLDFGVEGTTPFLVMNYAPNGTLRDRHPKGHPLPHALILDYVRQVASALQYAHNSKVIHRDIKPENMLLGPRGEILLSDFGIALVAQSSRYQSTKDMAGTVAYMAPEQIEAHPLPASDQYSLGIVLYEWLSGARPFQGTFTEIALKHSMVPPPSLREKVPNLSPEIEQVVFTALAKDPKNRFGSIQAFARALELASQPVPVEPPMLPISPPGAFPLPAADYDQKISESAISTTPVLSPRPSIGSPEPTLAVENYSQQPGQTLSPADLVRRVPHVRQKRLSPSHIGLFVALVLLIIGGGSFGLSALRIYLQTQPTATGTVALDYNKAVATNGIMDGFDAQHTYTNPYETILNVSNVAKLTPAWSAPTQHSIYSSPIVDNGVVYVGSDKLYAFDATSGQLKWAVSAGLSSRSTPAVANGVIYYYSSKDLGNNNYDNELYAFNAATGQQKWAAPTGDGRNSSITVAKGVVYISASRLYAFDAVTGQQKWIASTGDGFHLSPAVANGVVYVGSGTKLYAFDAATGLQQWNALVGQDVYPSGRGIISSPSVANEVVYINSVDGLYAFDAATGQQKWPSFKGQRGPSWPAVFNGIVYLGSEDNKLYALDAATGQQKWVSSPTGYSIRASPMVASGVVYVGSGDGRLYAFDATTGQQKWISPKGSPISSSPLVANGVVYACAGYNLYAFHLS